MSESNNPSVPSEVVDAFQSAAITALQELTQIEAYPDPTASQMEPSSGQVVLAAIRLLRPVPGTMTLVLAADTASQLAARYLPHGTRCSDDMIDDVAGEFANVIAGQAKTILKGSRYHFTMSTPVVTRPESRAPSPVAADVKIAASLISELGRVLLLVDLLPCTNT
jgi:CheY-specific phosphatase CheX